MGFGKMNQDRQERKFVPTTRKELKQIAKRAKAREEGKREVKKSRKEDRHEKVNSKLPRGVDAIKSALMQCLPVKVFKPQLFDQYLEFYKEQTKY